MNDDATLLRQYTENGSEAAFAEIVRRYVDLVYGAAMRRTGSDAHLSNDVAQQVFTSLARTANRLSPDTVLGAWLHTATRNAAIKLMISEQRRRVRETQALALEAPGDTGGAVPKWDEVGPLLDAAIDELPESDRASLVFRFFERRAFGEIGARLRISEDSARMRTERALEKLRLALARRGVASTGAALAAVVSSQPLISAPIGLAATLASQAVAAAGAGAVATLTSLMTAKFATTAIYIGISAALSTVFLGVAVYEFNIASSIKASTALIDNQLSKELEQLTELKRAEEEGRRRAVQASQVNKAAATVKANAPATILDAKKEGKREAAKFFAMHPEIRTQQLELEKNGWRKFYRPFLLKANLTAAQFEQLVSIGAENALENAVLTPRGMSGDGSVPPPVDQLRAVLGNNGYMQFEAFEQSHAAYDLVLEMATTANFREPIPPSQLEQIAQIIIANTTKPSTEFNAFGTVEWDKAAAQIKSILTPEQWNAAYTSLLGEAFNRAYAQQQAAQGGK